MSHLRRFTLQKNDETNRWDLTRDGSHRAVHSFLTKAHAMAKGALERALGSSGGSVRIHKRNGQFGEERTFPQSRDPKRSRG